MISHSTVQAGGLSFHVATAGDRSRPLLLCLHGFPECWYSWRRQLEGLSSRFFVAAPDMRGYGATDKPTGLSPYTLDAVASDVPALVEALGYERAFVVGHDWGGAVAWHAASAYPERVQRLAALNCPHPGVFVKRVLSGDLRQIRRSFHMLLFQLPFVPELLFPPARLARLIRSTAVKRDAISREDVAEFERILSSPGSVRGALAYYRAMRLALLPRRYRAVKETWTRGVTMPALLLWGERDPFLGTALLDGHDRFVRSLRVQRIPDAGHWVQQEAAETVNRELAAFFTP